MKALTKEEMKKIGAGAGNSCSAGYSCINRYCWREIRTREGSVWVTYGISCG